MVRQAMDRPRKKRKTNIAKAITAQSRSTFVQDTNNFYPVAKLTIASSLDETLPQRSTRSRSCELLSR